MSKRKLLQYGWISGPVECVCSECDWASHFHATDASVPAEVMAQFEAHDCRRHSFVNTYIAPAMPETNSAPSN